MLCTIRHRHMDRHSAIVSSSVVVVVVFVMLCALELRGGMECMHGLLSVIVVCGCHNRLAVIFLDQDHYGQTPSTPIINVPDDDQGDN